MPGPEVVIETISLSKMLVTAAVAAAPVVGTGIVGFVKLKTRFEAHALRDDEAHERIESKQDEQNGHIAENIRAISETRTEIEGIKSTCTERGRLEKEIRAQINQELERLGQTQEAG